MCPTECVPSSQPVCGTDGNTYGSECELHVRACTQQTNILVAAQGDCSESGKVPFFPPLVPAGGISERGCSALLSWLWLPKARQSFVALWDCHGGDIRETLGLGCVKGLPSPLPGAFGGCFARACQENIISRVMGTAQGHPDPCLVSGTLRLRVFTLPGVVLPFGFTRFWHLECLKQLHFVIL